MTKIDKINEKELNETLENVRNILMNVLKDDLRRIKLRSFVLDSDKTKKVDNRYLIINEIKNLKRIPTTNKEKRDREFLDKLKHYINSEKFKESVQKYPVLYEFIIKILFEIDKSKYEIPLLERLKEVVDTKNKDVITKYIKEHLGKIKLFLDQFKEEKLKKEINYLLSLINETEIEYLRTKLEELKTLDTKKINEFIEKIIASLITLGKHETYDKRLVTELNNLKKRDKGLKEKEIEYLNKLLPYIDQWTAQGYSNQYFYDVVGMFEEEVKKIVHVLKTNFKDEELVKIIQKSPAIRNLVFYSEMVHYFDQYKYFDHKKKEKLGLLGMVYKGAKEGDWKDFETVVKNVKKESKFVKEHFGDVINIKNLGGRTYADALIWIEAQKHESLMDWEAYLAQIVKELKSYSNFHEVLENAKARLKEKINRKLVLLYDELTNEKRELKRTLERRVSKLRNENITAVYKLDRTIKKRLNELRNIERVSVRRIMNKLMIENIKLNAEWSLMRRRYGILENKFGNYLGEYIDRFVDLSLKLDVKGSVDYIMRYINSSLQYKRYFKKFSDTIDLNNARKATPNIISMMFANAVLDYIDDSITELSDESFTKVNNSLKDIHTLNKLKDQVIMSQKNVLDYLNYVEGIHFNKNEVNKIIPKIVKPVNVEVPVRIGG